MSTTARAEKIRALEARLAALRQEHQAAEQRARAAASKAERARDTRRKVLAGAYLLQQVGGPEQAALLCLGGVSLAEWLRPADRALFVPSGEGTIEDAPPDGAASSMTAPHVAGGVAR